MRVDEFFRRVPPLDKKPVKIHHEFKFRRVSKSSFGRNLPRKDSGTRAKAVHWRYPFCHHWLSRSSSALLGLLGFLSLRSKAQTVNGIISEFCFSTKINLDARERFNWDLIPKFRFLQPNNKEFEINLETCIL